MLLQLHFLHDPSRIQKERHLRLFFADASPARVMLEAWAEDADGGELGPLLQRYGAEPPLWSVIASLSILADSAAENIIIQALAGAVLLSRISIM